VFLDGTRYLVWLVIHLQLGLLVLGGPFLRLWLGERLAMLSYPTMAILSIPLVLVLSQSISSRILYGIGRLRWFAALVVFQAAINIGAGVALVARIGVEGAALGTAIANVCFSVLLGTYTCRLLGVPLLKYARRSFAVPLLVAPLGPITWLITMKWLPITGWGSFVVVGSLGSFAYGSAAAIVEFNAARFAQRSIETDPSNVAPSTVIDVGAEKTPAGV
jgi:O-antigen/teichoic acid export membrane protein